MEQPRKAPAIVKEIENISEDDIRVRLLGEIIERKENSILLKDETGQIRVTGTDGESAKFARVFGRPMKTTDGIVIEAELVQNMDALNKKAYKRWEQQRRRRFT